MTINIDVLREISQTVMGRSKPIDRREIKSSARDRDMIESIRKISMQVIANKRA